MGNAQPANMQFADSLEPLRKFDNACVRTVLDKYLELDLDFGIPRDDLQKLFREAEMDLGEDTVNAVFEAFPKTKKSQMLNALDFIEGFAVLAPGSFQEKASLMFDIFDFQKRAEISFDELTIMFMCASEGLLRLSGADPAIADGGSDEQVAQMVRQDFGMTAGQEQDVPKEQFMAWAKEKAPREPTCVSEVLCFLSGKDPVEASAQEEEAKVSSEEPSDQTAPAVDKEEPSDQTAPAVDKEPQEPQEVQQAEEQETEEVPDVVESAIPVDEAQRSGEVEVQATETQGEEEEAVTAASPPESESKGDQPEQQQETPAPAYEDATETTPNVTEDAAVTAAEEPSDAAEVAESADSTSQEAAPVAAAAAAAEEAAPADV